MSSSVPSYVPLPYRPLVARAAAGTGLPPNVVAAQANLEAGFNARAVSPTGAEGWLQFEPATWASTGVPGSPFDPAAATTGYVRLMGGLLRRYGGNVRDTLAAYNAGPGNLAAGYGYADTILARAGAPSTLTAGPASPATATGGSGGSGAYGGLGGFLLKLVLTASLLLAGMILAGVGVSGLFRSRARS